MIKYVSSSNSVCIIRYRRIYASFPLPDKNHSCLIILTRLARCCCCLFVINRWSSSMLLPKHLLRLLSSLGSLSHYCQGKQDTILKQQAPLDPCLSCPLSITSWIIPIARRFVRSLMFALFATLEMHLIGSSIGTLRSSHAKVSCRLLSSLFLLCLYFDNVVRSA